MRCRSVRATGQGMIRPQSPLRICHQKTVFYGQGLDALDLSIWPEDTQTEPQVLPVMSGFTAQTA